MRRAPLFIAVIALISCQPTIKESASDALVAFAVEATNDSLINEVVEVELQYLNEEFALYHGEILLPIQFVDESGNGAPDRAFFQVTQGLGEKQLYHGRDGVPAAESAEQVALVFQDGKGKDLETWTSKDGLPMRFDGPVLENSWGAWRLRQSSPFVLDAIGKGRKELSLSTASSLQETGVYSDLMDETNSLGVAALGVYNFSDMIPLASGDARELTTVSAGPIVAELSEVVRGVEVRGEKLDFQINYRLEANKPWLDVSMELLSSSDLTLKYGVGLPRHRNAADFIQGKRGNTHFAYTYGLQTIDNLHLGNALLVNDNYVLDLHRDNSENHFYMIDPVKKKIAFRVMSVWSGGLQAIADETTFIQYVRECADRYGQNMQVTVSYPGLGL